MGKHDFKYFFHEGLSNMFSHGFMSFAAIGITVACLLIMGTFTLVAVNADANLKQAEQDNEILAFVDDSYTEAQAKALQKKLEAVDNVASVTFISREEAMQSFISEHPDEEYFQDLDPNILRDRFAIKVKELKLQSQTVELIKPFPASAARPQPISPTARPAATPNARPISARANWKASPPPSPGTTASAEPP